MFILNLLVLNLKLKEKTQHLDFIRNILIKGPTADTYMLMVLRVYIYVVKTCYFVNSKSEEATKNTLVVRATLVQI